MEDKIQWRGFSWAIGPESRCPECGKATLCWRHLYMAERYAQFIESLRREVGEGKDAERFLVR